jgi:hypothetical protein
VRPRVQIPGPDQILNSKLGLCDPRDGDFWAWGSLGGHRTAQTYSFPSDAMDHIPREELPALGRAAHLVVQEGMDSGMWVFGGGVAEDVEAVMVAGDGTISAGTYPHAGMSPTPRKIGCRRARHRRAGQRPLPDRFKSFCC